MSGKQIDLLASGLVDSSGNVLQAGTVELFEAGTSTNILGYSDQALSSSLGSTVTLDSRGAKLVFVDGLVDVKMVVLDSEGGSVATYDGLDYTVITFNIIDSDPEFLLQNTDQEDTDGGRQSIIRHKGEQSGGELSTLVTTTASHEGAVDDEKGKYTISVNDGNDGNSPSVDFVFDPTGMTIPGDIVVSGTVDGLDIAAHVAADDHTQYSLVDGTRSFTGGITVTSGGANITGNIAVTGTVDGVDVATDSTTNGTHRSSTGVDHSYIDQDVTTSATPDFAGVFFNGDSADANKLDDYEEGTFTPTFSNIGTGTYGKQVGSYTKVGDMVTVRIHIKMATLGSASGNVVIDGLPFTTSATADSFYTTSSVYGKSFNSTGINLAGSVGVSDTTILMNYDMGGTGLVLSHTILGALGQLFFTLTYKV